MVANGQTVTVTSNGQTLEIGSNAYSVDVSTGIYEIANVYEGSYSITPTSETQTLQTEHLMMADNLTVNPIPSNYGLITWDGSTLTVS